ncbi:MAG: hypothetical protein CMM50_08760 [Rhodospirillaceae bacterium]|nr:hypothetical protein [Rhodospirillaceae bacterium]
MNEKLNKSELLRRRLRRRAAVAGMSLSVYLARGAPAFEERPTLAQIRERLKARAPMNPSVTPEQAVREERDRRFTVK